MALEITETALSQLHPESVPQGRVCTVTFLPDRRSALVSLLDKLAEDSVLSRWWLETGEVQVFEPIQHGRMIRMEALDAACTRALTATRRCGEGYASVRFMDLETGAVRSETPGRLLWRDASAERAWATDREGGLGLWDLTRGQRITRLDTALFQSKRWDPFVPVTRIHHDGARAVMVRDDDDIEVRALPSGEVTRRIPTGDELSALVLHPDGKRAITASFDAQVKVWDLDTGELLHTLTGGSDVSTSSPTVLPGGDRLFVAYLDSPPLIWSLRTGALERTCDPIPARDGHQGTIDLVRVTPDGQHALTAHQNHLLHVWELSTGKLDRIWEAPDPITALALAPDGRALVGDLIGRVTLLHMRAC